MLDNLVQVSLVAGPFCDFDDGCSGWIADPLKLCGGDLRENGCHRSFDGIVADGDFRGQLEALAFYRDLDHRWSPG